VAHDAFALHIVAIAVAVDDDPVPTKEAGAPITSIGDGDAVRPSETPQCGVAAIRQERRTHFNADAASGAVGAWIAC
jgi:hypothetical protein